MTALQIKEHSGLTFPEIADAAAVSYSTAFHGIHHPRFNTLATFCRVMSVMGLSVEESEGIWIRERM